MLAGSVVPEPAAMKDLDRVVDRRGVLDARVRDGVEHVAGDVGDRQADQARRRDAGSETTALDRRDVLADRVDLDDRGAGAEEELVEAPLLGLRHPFGRQAGQRRASAREDGDRQIAGAQVVDQLHDPAGGGLRALGGERVVGQEHLDPVEGDRVRAVADGDRAAVEPVAEDLLERRCDRERRLARADDDHPGVGFERVLAAGDRDSAVGQLNGLRRCAADVAGLEPGGGHPQREGAHLRHAGGGELSGVRDHAAIAAGNTSPG